MVTSVWPLPSMCLFGVYQSYNFIDGLLGHLCNVYDKKVKKYLDWEILINMIGLIYSLHSVLLSVTSTCKANSPFHREFYNKNCNKKVFHQCASPCAY